MLNDAVLMLISRNLHKKSSEVCIKTSSTPASLSFKGHATKHATVKNYGLLLTTRRTEKVNSQSVTQFTLSNKLIA